MISIKHSTLGGLMRHELRGGKLLEYPLSATDPDAAKYFVVCDKHPKIIIPIPLSLSSDLSIIDLAIQSLNSCVDCVLEKKEQDDWSKTRFPEGAEL